MRGTRRPQGGEVALGGTVNDVVLAMCAGGLRRLLLARGETLPEGLRAQMPMSLRAHGPPSTRSATS